MTDERIPTSELIAYCRNRAARAEKGGSLAKAFTQIAERLAELEAEVGRLRQSNKELADHLDFEPLFSSRGPNL